MIPLGLRAEELVGNIKCAYDTSSGVFPYRRVYHMSDFQSQVLNRMTRMLYESARREASRK